MSPDPSQPAHEAFERIAPRKPPSTTGDAARPERPQSSAGNEASRAGVSGQLLGALLGAATLLAVVLFWFLSSRPDTPTQTEASKPPPESADKSNHADANTAPTTRTSAADLLGNTKALQARAAAQQARASYEEQLERLTAASAELWAAEALAQAGQRATAGGDAFVARDFANAQQHYEFASNLTGRLIAEIPGRLERALSVGFAQLENGDKQGAQTQFELALKLSPEHPRAMHGLQRVAVFDEVAAKLQTARRLEEIGDQAGARNSYRQALQLDPDARSASQALARMAAAEKQSEFEQALGAAIAALDRGAYDTAELRLNRAAKIKPNTPAVRSAQSRLADARRVQRLSGLREEASARVAEENWAGAVQSYRQAQKIDPNIGFAAEGLAIAEPRARLAADLKDFADRPQRLATDSVADHARRALAWARSRDPVGPRLAAQIRAVEIALANAAKPVELVLQSDGQTTVEIYKVGNFGSFARHSLRLQPGRYVAIGSRPGYRDVRRNLDIPPGGGTLTIDIRCTEKI